MNITIQTQTNQRERVWVSVSDSEVYAESRVEQGSTRDYSPVEILVDGAPPRREYFSLEWQGERGPDPYLVHVRLWDAPATT